MGHIKSKILYPEDLVVKTGTTTLFRKSGLDGFHPDYFYQCTGFSLYNRHENAKFVLRRKSIFYYPLKRKLLSSV